MKEVIIKKFFGSDRIKLYENIKELPITRFQEMQKLFLMDAGIGSTMDDVSRHFSNLYQAISSNNQENALQEASNLHNNFWYIINGISFKSYVFVAMIHSINSELVRLPEDTDRIVERLEKSGLKYGQVYEQVEEVKKNLIQSFEPIFLLDLEEVQNSIYSQRLSVGSL